MRQVFPPFHLAFTVFTPNRTPNAPLPDHLVCLNEVIVCRSFAPPGSMFAPKRDVLVARSELKRNIAVFLAAVAVIRAAPFALGLLSGQA